MKKRILTVQDISCLGQCSLTVALPIISAAGIETCAIPSAVLSTHTYRFQGFTFRDLTEDIPAIEAHWRKEGLTFDALYTGYLGNHKQVAYVKSLRDHCLKAGAKAIIDPAMADGGQLYAGFGQDYVEDMKSLCFPSDVLVPNITEACFLTDTPYREDYDEAYILDLAHKMEDLGAKNVILTSVSYAEDKTGVLVDQEGHIDYYEHKRYPKGTHGTGDIYSSAFVGAWLNGIPMLKAAQIAADYVLLCIENSLDDPDHWYGAHFEEKLFDYMQMIRQAL